MYESGTKVTDKPEILFARMDIKEVMAKVEEMNAANAPAVQTEAEAEEKADDGIDLEAKPEITYDDFAKLQFQVGEIIACEAVPKSKKLLCSQVKVGSQVRQILSGIKAYYSPEEMVGKKVMVVTNLKPAKPVSYTHLRGSGGSADSGNPLRGSLLPENGGGRNPPEGYGAAGGQKRRYHRRRFHRPGAGRGVDTVWGQCYDF